MRDRVPTDLVPVRGEGLGLLDRHVAREPETSGVDVEDAVHAMGVEDGGPLDVIAHAIVELQ